MTKERRIAMITSPTTPAWAAFQNEHGIYYVPVLLWALIEDEYGQSIEGFIAGEFMQSAEGMAGFSGYRHTPSTPVRE